MNLGEEHRVFGQLEAACREWCEHVNARPHRETRRAPAEMLAEEQARLHPLPAAPFTVAFGTTRRVNWDATVSVEGVRYSVPHPLVDTRVWVRFHGDDLVVTAVADAGPVEVARHPRSTPGSPSINPEHYPPPTAAARAHGERPPRATSAEEATFLALGPGAAAWLVEAAAAGPRGVRRNIDGFVSHTLRKTVASFLNDAAVSTRKISDQPGHSTVSMTQDRYLGRHLTDRAPKTVPKVSRDLGATRPATL